jgi:hypothetical protein
LQQLLIIKPGAIRAINRKEVDMYTLEDAFEPKGTKEEMIKELECALEIERPENPFKVGDYVSPKETSTKKGRGRVHKVVEIFTVTRKTFEHGSPIENHDMTVAVIVAGNLKYYHQDSTEYELL